jgi:hypothetical protein
MRTRRPRDAGVLLAFSLLRAAQLPRDLLEQEHLIATYLQAKRREWGHVPVLTPFSHRTCRHPGLELFGEENPSNNDGSLGIESVSSMSSFRVIYAFIKMHAIRVLSSTLH